ncbi:toxin-antitoxin system HicB family antitoxin [Labrys portucalensis]|uniref:Toxin-antitoxin system HicB family antitoxin n=2 Tax=Labrys TaxID=204476 RepID=A0ABV3PKM0_9HYPH|nr:toxin-antitoxin system HicB family antitoxin [Labrys neptuniae]MDT3379506.1 toxin-antitoxin system HicB family antitoxin [Labrys neptuniae]
MAHSSNYALRMPTSLKKAVEEFARQDGTTINQFIVSAVAEKLSALTAAEFFAQRRADGDIDWALAFLSREGGEAPAADDRLPAKYHGKPGA